VLHRGGQRRLGHRPHGDHPVARLVPSPGAAAGDPGRPAPRRVAVPPRRAALRGGAPGGLRRAGGRAGRGRWRSSSAW
jgi:hypothetical protein